MSALPHVKTAPVVASALSPARVRLGVAAGGLSVVLLLAACGKSEAPPAAAGGGMPPPEVGVVVATPGDVGLVTELPGRLEASRVAQVRAREDRAAAGLADVFRGGFTSCGVEVHEQQIRPGFRKCESHGPSHSLRGTGDEGDFS